MPELSQAPSMGTPFPVGDTNLWAEWEAGYPHPAIDPQLQALSVPDQAIHVWRASLALEPARIATLRSTLTEDELARADRFRFPLHRARFIAARGALREILAGYLGVAASQVRFLYNRWGKPFLDSPFCDSGIHFSVSHSASLALFALRRNQLVGVDLEQVCPDFDWKPIAERYFSVEENAAIDALPVDHRPYAFFLSWTQKEAFLKARGEGLSFPLDQVETPLTTGVPGGIRNKQDLASSPYWSVQVLHPAAEYLASIVAEGQGWCLARWTWQG